ncbi:MAG: hypothetical protein L0H53_14705 [Candidatus Nitrosocosmicus sp.]|nr:hypothetical protein [Candidatus Nitrosocosmicus sp.]MDN5867911.1 hypothetical protein [Candidatus Nitrosocosmicus sp.]
MTYSKLFSILFISMMTTILASLLTISSVNILTYATSSLGQSIQQSQQDLQSTINSQVQQSITDTINNINKSNDSTVNTITSNQTQNTTGSSIDVIKGGITSLQNDPLDNTTTWILGGVYRMENLSSEAPTFNASFYMVKTDGNSSHSHEIYDLFLNTPLINNTVSNSKHVNGTTTVTMRDGPVSNVPTNITILDDSAISIWLDSTRVDNHFGDSPIYGTQELLCVDTPAYCK